MLNYEFRLFITNEKLRQSSCIKHQPLKGGIRDGLNQNLQMSNFVMWRSFFLINLSMGEIRDRILVQQFLAQGGGGQI